MLRASRKGTQGVGDDNDDGGGLASSMSHLTTHLIQCETLHTSMLTQVVVPTLNGTGVSCMSTQMQEPMEGS